MKRLIFLICAAMIISGCSFRPTSFTGAKHAKPKTVRSLIGQNQSEIRNQFGSAALIRTESPYSLWSYQAGSCVLLVYFDKDGICRFAETRGNCQ